MSLFGWVFGTRPDPELERALVFGTHTKIFGRTPVKSVAIYDAAGHIVASIHIDSENDELDVHLTEGYWASGDGQLRAKESMRPSQPSVTVNGQQLPIIN